MIRKFKRTNEHAGLAGVCSGLAYALGLQTWIVRMVTVLLLLYIPFVGIIYFIVGLCTPEWKTDPEDYVAICGSTNIDH